MELGADEKKLVEDINQRLDRPLVLIGLMGAGKTRIGKGLAEALGLPFVDSDDEIQEAAGMAVAEIFEKFGEAYFRGGEKRVIERLLKGPVRVIATGGGAVMDPETAERIWNSSLSMWVRAELPVMLERTARNDRRPLLRRGNAEEILKNLMEKRYPVYQKADMTIDSHSGSVDDIVNQTLAGIHRILYP